MTGKEQLVTLGRVGKTHGIKGAVRVYSYTSPAANLMNYRHFRARAEHWQGELEVQEVRTQGDFFVVHFQGYDDPETAQGLVGVELAVPEAELPALEPEEFYWHQLIGLKVINQDNQLLGKVVRLLETGANDVLVVQGCDGSIDQRERLIPYLRETIIRHVDLDRQVIEADWAADYLL